MIFIDTNVLVYYVDCRDALKSRTATTIVLSAIDSPAHLISTQVLAEFANVAMKKLRLTTADTFAYVEEFLHIPVVEQRPEWVCRALTIKQQYGLQFYDSLLLAAAEASGCDEIWTEDLSDGQTYCGVKAVNPFK